MYTFLWMHTSLHFKSCILAVRPICWYLLESPQMVLSVDLTLISRRLSQALHCLCFVFFACLIGAITPNNKCELSWECTPPYTPKFAYIICRMMDDFLGEWSALVKLGWLSFVWHFCCHSTLRCLMVNLLADSKEMTPFLSGLQYKFDSITHRYIE